MCLYVTYMRHLIAVHELERFEQAAGDVSDDVQRKALAVLCHLQNLFQALPGDKLRQTGQIIYKVKNLCFRQRS